MIVIIKLRRPRMDEDKKMDIIGDYLSGFLIKEIAQRRNVSIRSVTRVITEARKKQEAQQLKLKN